MLLVRETRCDVDEVRHYGAVAISTASGEELYGQEVPNCLPLRSTAKPFLLGALLETVLANETFTPQEIALMSSSHNGEHQHVSTLIELLNRYHIPPEMLSCGVHSQWREWSIHAPAGNNCSGKHAAFLIASAVAGIPLSDYLSSTSIIHAAVIDTLARLCGHPPDAIGVDGCSLPTCAFPMGSIARLFRRYATCGLGASYETVRRAHVSAPFYVGGTDRLESYLIGKYGLSAKSGSDGIWALGVPEWNLGVVVKTWGGSEAASQAVLLDVLHQRGVLDIKKDAYLESYHNRDLLSLIGRKSGEVIVCFREHRENS